MDEPFVFLSNIAKADQALVAAAIASSGASVEWRDAPNEYGDPDLHGSIWGDGVDHAAFWDALNALKAPE